VRCPRAIACALLAALAATAAACGDGEDPPLPKAPAAALLDEALVEDPVSSARADADLKLEPVGSSGPVEAEVEGPFDAGFDLEVLAEGRGYTLEGSVVHSGGDLFVVFFGENYRLEPEARDELPSTSALSPRSWFARPRYDGVEEAGGADCAHIVAALDSAALEAQLRELTATLGLSPTVASGGTIEAWVGLEGHDLRRLRLDAPGALRLDLELTELDGDFEIEPPEGGGFRPLSDLTERLPGFAS
jgi:hypothetical protein